MKNRYIEDLKRRAKLYHRNKRGDDFSGGVVSRYSYAKMSPDTLTFWDDGVFIVNDYRVGLWWTHPRYEYQQRIEAETVRRVDKRNPDSNPFLGLNQYTGSAIRAAMRRRVWPAKEPLQRYFALLAEEERQVAQEVAFEVRPFMSIRWNNWCKELSLCVLIEVRSESDLRDLARLARQLVKRETTLVNEFSDYWYGQHEWISEYDVMEEQRLRQMNLYASAQDSQQKELLVRSPDHADTGKT
jgi:hypothetical protein